MFLVSAFRVKRARLLLWLVFFFFFRQTKELTPFVPFFVHCTLLLKVLDGERIQSISHEIQNHSKAEGSPFPIFRHYETFPAPFSAL